MNKAAKRVNFHTLRNSRKHGKQKIIKITKHIPLVILNVLLQNTITKGTGSLLFYGAKCHGDCLPFITKDRVCVCVCLYVCMWYAFCCVWLVPTRQMVLGGVALRTNL